VVGTRLFTHWHLKIASSKLKTKGKVAEHAEELGWGLPLLTTYGLIKNSFSNSGNRRL
jgi:hypothetical protein